MRRCWAQFGAPLCRNVRSPQAKTRHHGLPASPPCAFVESGTQGLNVRVPAHAGGNLVQTVHWSRTLPAVCFLLDSVRPAASVWLRDIVAQHGKVCATAGMSAI